MLCVRACRGGEEVCGDKERRVERNEFHGLAFLGSFVFRRHSERTSNFAVTHSESCHFPLLPSPTCCNRKERDEPWN